MDSDYMYFCNMSQKAESHDSKDFAKHFEALKYCKRYIESEVSSWTLRNIVREQNNGVPAM